MMRRALSRPSLVLVALLAVAALAGCRSSGPANDPILRLSAAESLEKGKDLMAHKKYGKARPFLSHAYEAEPNSAAGREGLLLLADSYYLDGGEANWIQSEAKYRDFLNRFPTSDQAAYAQYQIANSLSKRIEKANRDQTPTRKALEAYQELLRLYPTSDYALQGRDKMQEVRDRLAKHELVVAQFYLDYRYPPAAVTRLQHLLDEYPAYSGKDEVLYDLGIAYRRSRLPEHAGKAQEVFDRLRREFPDSPWIAKIPTSPEEPKAKPLPVIEKAAASPEKEGEPGR